MNTPTSSAPGTPTPADDRVDGSSSCLELLAAAPADVPDLPILDEVPLLGSAMELLRGIDRLVAQLLEVLIELEDQDVAESTTGVMLEQWMAIVGRRTGSDRRMLLTTCEVLRRLPSLRIAFFQEAAVSWAQVRAVVLAVHRLPRALDDVVDGEVSRTIDACRDADPDMLTSAVSRAARSWDPTPTRKEQQAADRDEFLAMQPRLDGSGGQLFGDLGPLSFATVDAALTPPRRTDPASSGEGAEPDPDVHEPGGRLRIGKHRARQLVELCDASLSGGATGDRSASRDRRDGTAAGMGSRPQLLVRIELGTLLDRDSMPAELLTRLTGGKLWLDAGTARRLVDERGVDLRAIVLDDRGRVVGVGRRSRIAPGWLADATLGLHDTCSRPECAAPARRCQVDHAVPWHPVRPQDPLGRTDIDQLAPLCDQHNARKERSGWRVSQSADGSRHWAHPRSGLTTVTRPATWRPVRPSSPDSSVSDLVQAEDLSRASSARERRATYDLGRRCPPPAARDGTCRPGSAPELRSPARSMPAGSVEGVESRGPPPTWMVPRSQRGPIGRYDRVFARQARGVARDPRWALGRLEAMVVGR